MSAKSITSAIGYDSTAAMGIAPQQQSPSKYSVAELAERLRKMHIPEIFRKPGAQEKKICDIIVAFLNPLEELNLALTGVSTVLNWCLSLKETQLAELSQIIDNYKNPNPVELLREGTEDTWDEVLLPRLPGAVSGQFALIDSFNCLDFGLGGPVEDDLLQYLLTVCPSLRELYCSFESERSLQIISQFSCLDTLVVTCWDNNGISGAGTGELLKLRRLQSLKLSCCEALTDKDLERLAASGIKLSELSIAEAGKALQGSFLKSFSNLRKLVLKNCSGLQDDHFAHLPSFHNLQSFVLISMYSPITPRMRETIGKMIELTELTVGNPHFSDSDLVALYGLKKLQKLDISLCSSVTQRGVEALQQKLPHLLIDRNPRIESKMRLQLTEH